MHEHSHHQTSSLGIAFGLNLGFAVLELIGGVLINSVAILSDALHDMGDSLSLGLAWVLGRYAERGSDPKYTYGYRRYSLLGALLNTLILIIGSLFILSEAIPRLLKPERFHAPGMIGFALLGVLVNGFAAWRLRSQHSQNVQVVGWHLLEDALGWIAVLIVGVVSLVVDLPILDPLLSLLITVYILFNVLRKFKDTVDLFLQAAPPEVDMDAIHAALTSLQDVEEVHHLHAWSLDGEHNVFSGHLVVAGDTTRQESLRIKQACREQITGYGFTHVTIEIEYGRDDCSLMSPKDGT